MSIDRHNYEEFFILYLDNELDSRQRSEVEAFTALHPDLAAELDLLRQTRFDADKSLVFEDKETLRFSSDPAIGLSNYEEYLLLYIDGELNAVEKAAVEKFAAAHPAIQEELVLLQRTRLQPEPFVAFPGKDSLYHKEEGSRRVISLRWTRMAAAALLLFAISITAFLVFTRNEEPTISVVASSDGIEKTGKEAPLRNTTVPDTLSNRQVPAQNDLITDPGPQPAIADVQPYKKGTDVQKVPREIPVQTKQDESLVADAPQKEHNNLPQPTYNPNMKKPIEDNIYALTNLKENNPDLDVTSSPPSAFNLAVNRPQPADESTDAGQSEKKNNLRGLLRKVTRTFEKATSIKATDDDDRLLVAGLAIKL